MVEANLDFAKAMTLVSQGTPLKLKVLDTILFDNASLFCPTSWVHTNLEGEAELRSVRHLKLEPIVQSFMESCYSSKPRVKDPKAFVVLMDDTRVLVNLLRLWKLRVSFPRGVKGLQLMHAPDARFDRNYLIVEFWTNKQSELQCKVFRSPMANVMREIAEPDTELVDKVVQLSKSVLEKLKADKPVHYMKLQYLLDVNSNTPWLCGLEGIVLDSDPVHKPVKANPNIIINGRSVYTLNPKQVILSRKRPMTAGTVHEQRKVVETVESIGNTIQSTRIRVTPTFQPEKPKAFRITTMISKSNSSTHNRTIVISSSNTTPRSTKESPLSNSPSISSKSHDRNASLKNPKKLRESLSLDDRGKDCKGDFCDYNLNYNSTYNRRSRFLVDSRLIEVAKKSKFSPMMNPSLLCTEIVVNGRTMPSQFENFVRTHMSDHFAELSEGHRVPVCVSCYIVYTQVSSSLQASDLV
mmetsp:Transcript_5750/g.10266  ORF Transcript_5750/g.10266 Transcript_5750/m.10266 type:complete len:467 (-) Transcript_5750:592-1992(-)